MSKNFRDPFFLPCRNILSCIRNALNGRFCTAASTAVYVFLYAVHYFIFKTKMTGFFQTAFYFGHSLIFCIGLGTLTGSMGFLGARQFILQLYSGLKCD